MWQTVRNCSRGTCGACHIRASLSRSPSIVLLWLFHPWRISRVMEHCTLTRLFNNWLIPCNTQGGRCDGNVNESVRLKEDFPLEWCIWHHYITRAEQDSGKHSNVPRSQEKAAQTDVQKRTMTGKTVKRDKTGWLREPVEWVWWTVKMTMTNIKTQNRFTPKWYWVMICRSLFFNYHIAQSNKHA